MSERILLYTQFAGVGLHNGSSIRQMTLEASGNKAITNIFYLSNGVKYDVDGTTDGVNVLGDIRATFRITAASHSSAQASSRLIQAALNKRDILQGIEYGVSSSVVYSCGARLVSARPVVRVGMAMAMNRQYQIDLEMMWELFSPWA